MLYCPNCKKPMIAVERNDIELDYCMSCEGFWFDHGEWNILCKKLICENFMNKADDIYDIPAAATGEKPRKCPICGKNMEKFILYDVILDRCPDKHGVWFDKNEFSTCVNTMNSKSKKKETIEFLGEVFNK